MTKKTAHIKITILIALAIVPCFLEKTSALALNDCDTILGNVALFGKRSIDGEIYDFGKVYPKDALERAINNLTAYCCKDILKQGVTPDARCKDADKLPTDGPDSPYLFDHLIDVGLRRLDILNNYNKTPIVNSDPTGSARRLGPGKDNRKGIKTEAESTDATSPLKIVNGYKLYRTLHEDWMFKKTHLKIDNLIEDQDEKPKLQNFLTNYDIAEIVSLADKYNNLCRIARNIYERKPGQKISIGGDKLSKDRSYYTDCQTMVTNRMNQENAYVRGILINKATDMLQKSFEATHKKFVQDKLATLQETISRIRDLISTVVRQAPYCKKCSN